MPKIVQCVPNISEGRDLKKIESIIQPLKNKSGFTLVSYEPDYDYNRTVITLLGDPHQMIVPLIEFFEKAIHLIDMNLHQGEHPRMGAVDVVPFIPISDIKMEECIHYAEQLAIHVSDMFHVPVFLYAEAAKQENRVKLPSIRKGEFEGMKEKIKEAEWHPDYGQPSIHPTFGAVAIGARMPLVAYNIDLGTHDEKVAKEIAKTIRQSSGGFQYVQAGPATLQERGHVQVTMNILDYKKNPLYRIYETVAMESRRFGVSVLSSEVIGLIPKDALMDSLKYYTSVQGLPVQKNPSLDELTKAIIPYLKLRDFSQEKIIEAHIKE